MKKLVKLLLIFLFVLVSCTDKIREVRDYSIEQFMSNINMFGGDFSADETKLLVTSDQSGVYNAYTIPIEGGELTPLTQSDSTSVFAISFFPNDDRILYHCDNNGNEIYHIFLRDIDGTVRDLTADSAARSTFYKWNFDEQSFLYGSNKRDERFMDLYEMDIETFEPKMIFKNAEGLEYEGTSRNEKYCAFSKPITTSNNELYILDMETGEFTHISEHTGNAIYTATGFSHDNNSLFYLTDEGSEFTYLVRYGIPTCRIMVHIG